MIGTRHILGLAIDDSGVVATELRTRSGRTEICGSAEITWEQELTPENAKALGHQLRDFLRSHGLSAKRAVVGLAAKWVLAREIEAPPASPEALAGILGIQAEREFSLNAGDLIFDYCGRTSTSEKSRVLLLAARRQTIDQIKDLTEAAGLQVQSITVSALACGKAMPPTSPACRYGLYARPTYCEFWTQSDDRAQSIKHVQIARDGTSDGYAELLGSTIQRMILLSSKQDQSPPHLVAAYDGCGLSDAILDRLNRRLEPQIKVRDGGVGLLPNGRTPSDHPQETGSVAGAAVAMTALGADRLPVDFLDPRIGASKTPGHKRIVGWAAFVGAACIIGLAAMVADWHGDKRDIAAYTQQLNDMSGDIETARKVVDRISYAGSWISTEPRFLECLRLLTEAFPEEPYVWATSLALNESGVGSVVGKARNEVSFYEVLDKIKQNKAFSDVKMIHIRDAGRDSREKEFAINFKYQGAK